MRAGEVSGFRVIDPGEFQWRVSPPSFEPDSSLLTTVGETVRESPQGEYRATAL